MATQVPPKKNAAYVMYVSLASQASTHTMQANPTLAAGDVKVATDGGALGNLATLPVVTPAASKLVKVDLSASEMNGDNVTIIFSDAAGAEWDDLVINLQTAARQLDDLAFPTVSGRALDVTATGAAGIDWANVENPTTAVNLSATNIDIDQAVASVSGAVGSVTTVSDKTGYSLSAAGVQAVWDALTSALTAVGSIGKLIVDNLNATISSRASQASVDTIDDLLDTEVGAIKAKTDLIPASPAAVADIPTALQNADALLNRDMSAVADTNARSPLNALRFLRNKWSISGSTLTVTEENDTTAAWTAALTTSASAESVTGSDPT